MASLLSERQGLCGSGCLPRHPSSDVVLAPLAHSSSRSRRRWVAGQGRTGRPEVVACAQTEVQVTEEAKHGPIGCMPCMDGTYPVEIDDARVITKFVAETLLPTRHGKFRVRGYKHSIDGGMTFTEPTAIMSGDVEGREDVPVRVHDACFTSEVLGSLKCDCAEQLALALEMIYKNPPGVVIYLQQEGRGIGLANKIAAYSLQERGLDTVDANRALGLPDDCREYTSVRNIINGLGIKSIKLITNNPRKMNELTALGINVTGRLPCLVKEANEFNVGYLQAKQNRMDHLLEGQFCYWNHDGEPTQPTPTTEANGGMGLPNNLQADHKGRVIMVPDMSPEPGSDGAGADSNGKH